MNTRTIDLPKEIIEAEVNNIRFIASMKNKPESFCIITYGCQMNVHDSETLSGMLHEMGMRNVSNKEEADLVIFNTCCIRDNAERRALGNVTWLKELKKKKPEMIIAVCGCMMQQEGMRETILTKYPFVNLAFGTHNLYHFPTLLYDFLQQKKRIIEVINNPIGCIPEGLPISRSDFFNAYITIMYGCNNHCSYCIVPMVRGNERSRKPSSIFLEVEELVRSGVKEIMLLGQNVNSYGKDLSEGITFAKLLSTIDQLGVERVRFMTSHPKDISDDLIQTIANSKHVLPALHLPVQHGSNRILKSMNRHYTREKYLSIIEKLRNSIPHIELTTDIIVGYPGESDQDFNELLDLILTVRYVNAYTFIYSPRAGTPAASMKDQIDPAISSNRIQQLIELQKTITSDRLSAMVGDTHHVLVTGPSKRDSTFLTGKDEYNISVNFEGNPSLIGTVLPVKIIEKRETTLLGKPYNY